MRQLVSATATTHETKEEMLERAFSVASVLMLCSEYELYTLLRSEMWGMTALAKTSSNCKQQNHPFIREDVT
jgi:hypothetical protein